MEKSPAFDIWIIGPIIVLQLFSMIILRSVLPNEMSKHLVFSLAAFGIFGLVSQLEYRTFFHLDKWLYVVSLFLLLITFLIGEPTRGSIRWINIGSLSIQPSELIKPAMILSLASFSQKLELRRFPQLILYLILLFIPVIIIFIQPDLGSSIVLFLIGIVIAYIGGLSYKYVLLAITILVVSFPLMMSILKPYQQQRIEVFINPFADPQGSGYSVIQSMIAVGSGKIFGRGLGHGTQSQLRFLPERHSDFIFASLAEELGFIGVLMVIASYAILLLHCLELAKSSTDPAGSMLIIGVFSMIFIQIIENIGMNIGVLPVTGITLPLISSGGSSLLTIMVGLGLVQSVARRKKPIQTIELH